MISVWIAEKYSGSLIIESLKWLQSNQSFRFTMDYAISEFVSQNSTTCYNNDQYELHRTLEQILLPHTTREISYLGWIRTKSRKEKKSTSDLLGEDPLTWFVQNTIAPLCQMGNGRIRTKWKLCQLREMEHFFGHTWAPPAVVIPDSIWRNVVEVGSSWWGPPKIWP